MRTTIRLDDDLFRRVKALAAAEGRTIGDVVADALRLALDQTGRQQRDVPSLPTYGRSGTLPGVDLSDGGALRDLMDTNSPIDARR